MRLKFLSKFFKKQSRESSPYNKVFGIGYPKTGSTSLAVALRELGFDTLHDEHCIFPKAFIIGDLSIADRQFDACVNIYQWMFREFDRAYPNSKFVLTVRTGESWWESIRWWRDLGQIQEFYQLTINDLPYILKRPKQLAGIEELLGYFALFGCFGQDMTMYMQAYKRHNDAVVDYFKNRPQHLLVLNLEDKDKQIKLAEFLNKVPKESYPHEKPGVTEYIN